MVNPGISQRPRLGGLVAEVEERDAAQFGGYTWSEWMKLSYYEKVDGVAYHRVRKLMSLHTGAAVRRAEERATKTANKGRNG